MDLALNNQQKMIKPKQPTIFHLYDALKRTHTWAILLNWHVHAYLCTHIYMYIHIHAWKTHPLLAGCDTSSIFKSTTASVNKSLLSPRQNKSVFSTIYPKLEREDWFMPFSRALAQNETQIASSRIWTGFTETIFYHDNHCAKRASTHRETMNTSNLLSSVFKNSLSNLADPCCIWFQFFPNFRFSQTLSQFFGIAPRAQTTIGITVIFRFIALLLIGKISELTNSLIPLLIFRYVLECLLDY